MDAKNRCKQNNFRLNPFSFVYNVNEEWKGSFLSDRDGILMEQIQTQVNRKHKKNVKESMGALFFPFFLLLEWKESETVVWT